MRAAIYLRQSQDRNGDGLGVDRQREDVRRLIESRGWTVAGRVRRQRRLGAEPQAAPAVHRR